MRSIMVLLAALIGLATAGCAVSAGEPIRDAQGENFLVNRDRSGLAVRGYDVVAYFEQSAAVPGSERYRVEHRGATYQFSSAQHLALFEANPERYEPRFGGYCAYAASINKISPIDPEFWEIQDGRLILQHNQKATDAWHKDAPGNLVKADANWPGLVAKNGKPRQILVNVDDSGLAAMGYDVVAYFTDGQPVRGSAEHESVFGGARYHFASREHREIFELDPSRYEPAFGGYCAYAASINKVSPIDPDFWQIEDGRLLLQHTQKAWDLFNEDTAGNLARADGHWPGLVARHGK